MVRREQQMTKPTRVTRHRVGRVSFYEHHGGWWIYHRHSGRPVRRLVGNSAALAECEASILNARFTAESAGIALNSVPAIAEIGLAHQKQAHVESVDLVPRTSVSELRQAFLAHHENVLHSRLATVSRYRAATLYLEKFAEREKFADPLKISLPQFIEYLRTVEVSPNGHARSAKRRLRDKGVRYIVECCRSLYHFSQRQTLLPQHVPNPFTDMCVGGLRIRDAKTVFVFSAAQEIEFFNSASWWAFAIHFTLSKSGLRPGELAHAMIEDTDLTHGWLNVRNKPELGWITKTVHERRVPLIPEVVCVLRQVIGVRRGGPLFLREKIASGRSTPLHGSRAELAAIALDRLTAARTKKGAPLSRTEEARAMASVWRDAGAVPIDRIRTSFIRVANAPGLAATCPKSWRHTFATLLQEANVDLLVRQETMGHKSASSGSSALGMTAVYTHTTPEFQRREIERALRLRPLTLELSQRLLQQESQT
jgi:integrase